MSSMTFKPRHAKQLLKELVREINISRRDHLSHSIRFSVTSCLIGAMYKIFGIDFLVADDDC